MEQVPLAVYVVFTCLMASAFFVAFFGIVPPSEARRKDGTALAHYPHKGLWFEFKAQGQLLKDWRILALFIPMVACEIAIIVISTLNGQSALQLFELLLLRWMSDTNSRSSILQHSYKISKLRHVHLDASGWCRWNHIPAGQREDRWSTHPRPSLDRNDGDNHDGRLDWSDRLAV